MQGVSVIDQFLNVFTTAIDGGFGLLKPEVAFLTATLSVIDLTLAGLFWAMGDGADIVARLARKTLYVGFLVFLLNDFNHLAGIVFRSFAGLGLLATGSGLGYDAFLQPGRIAHVGIEAGRPMLDAVGQLMGFVGFFDNFVQIFVLMFAWVLVIAAFFLLAIQLFITIVEFKLTALAGFVLVPFGLWGKSAFLAERVLGNVMTTGVKVLVLAVVVGIGSTLFSQFITALPAGQQPTIEDALGIALASLVLLGLSIFCGRVAGALVSGAPQLSAAEAVETAAAAAVGVIALGGAGAALGRASAGLAELRAATHDAARSAAMRGAGAGTEAAPGARTGGDGAAGKAGAPPAAPDWAQRLRARQMRRSAGEAVVRPLRQRAPGGPGANPELDPEGENQP